MLLHCRLLRFKPLCKIPSPMSSTATSSSLKKRGRLRGVVFDMDGTLTVPVIDFPAMYRAVLGDVAYARAGGGSVDILKHIETWPPRQQQQAYETIAAFEKEGLDRLEIMPGLQSTRLVKCNLSGGAVLCVAI